MDSTYKQQISDALLFYPELKGIKSSLKLKKGLYRFPQDHGCGQRFKTKKPKIFNRYQFSIHQEIRTDIVKKSVF